MHSRELTLCKHIYKSKSNKGCFKNEAALCISYEKYNLLKNLLSFRCQIKAL